METKSTFNQKNHSQLKAEYQELVLRILDLWLKIPPDMVPNEKEELELSILEELAYAYVKEMQNRGMFVIMWMVTNG